MIRDFTFKKYKELVNIMLKEGFSLISVDQAIGSPNFNSNDKTVINRHDIDTKYDLPIAIEMARFEHSKNIRASYYFRSVPVTLNLEVIKKISDLGHEIGYHYEVMSLERGNEPAAVNRFRNDLAIFRNICEIKTICQHGGAMGYYNTTSVEGLLKIGWDYLRGKIREIEYFPSVVLWENYKFEDFGLIGDAYLSLDFEKFKYFSDTGQRWGNKGQRILDVIEEGENENITCRTTNDLIKIIESGKVKKINLLVHPANWHDNFYDWLKWRILQKVRNNLKKFYNPKVNR